MLYMMFFTLVPMVWAVLITFFSYSPTRQGGSFWVWAAATPILA